jgi:hypothetical protein
MLKSLYIHSSNIDGNDDDDDDDDDNNNNNNNNNNLNYLLSVRGLLNKIDELLVPVSEDHWPYILCLTEDCLELTAVLQANIDDCTLRNKLLQTQSYKSISEFFFNCLKFYLRDLNHHCQEQDIQCYALLWNMNNI